MLNIDGTTHQIDHIIVSKFGIYVIETKNFEGIITGSMKSNMWTQHIYRNKYKFNNPVHQNYGHIKALENLLHLKPDCFKSVVCFSNKSKLNIQDNNSSVINASSLLEYIYNFNDEIIIDDDINKIIKIINLNNIKDTDVREEHIKNINNKIEQNEKDINNMVCPKCGGKLVKRQGKYGEFIGCSNYPKCKFTSHIS